jgi:5-methylcytosine-specific restriction endonuclease McrA
MAWIESHQTLREHPKTKRLCRLLSINRREAVGLLHFLWWWAYDYAPEGDLSSLPDEDIADAIDWVGDAGVLVSSLIQAGWLDADRRIHDWEDYAQKWMERRRANRDRQKGFRDRQRLPIYERDGGCCRYCGRDVPVDGFIVDHVFPYRRGGSDHPDNLATACPSCNTKKNNRTPDEAGMPLLLLPSRNGYVAVSSSPRAGATGPDRTGPDLPDLTGPGLRLVALEDSADEPPTTMKAGPAQAQLLRKLSPEARGVIDYHRQCHGGRRSVRLTPVSVEVLEEAVADLGAERIKEGIRHMAGKMPPVTELSKGISAARTKRASDEAAAEPARVLPKVVGGSAHAAPPRRQISDDARRLLESDDPEWGRDR